MKFHKIVILIFLTALLLAACSPYKMPGKFSIEQPTDAGSATPEADEKGTLQVDSTPYPASVPLQSVEPQTDPTAVPLQADESLSDTTRSDAQGSVTVDIKPLNLDQPGNTLMFDVSMNTHSVDLSMDLVQLTILTTDTGITVQAFRWDGPRGGHHVEGKLSFPDTLDGKNLLNGANSITITIKDVDAAARTFTWQLPG